MGVKERRGFIGQDIRLVNVVKITVLFQSILDSFKTENFGTGDYLP